MDDAVAEKAGSRAVWKKRQQFNRRHRGRGGRGRGRGGLHRESHVEAQARVYDDDYNGGMLAAVDESGEDYGEWLELCPRDVPQIMRRQRRDLPDTELFVGGDCRVDAVVTRKGGVLDLGKLAEILGWLPVEVLLDAEADSSWNKEIDRSRMFCDRLITNDMFVQYGNAAAVTAIESSGGENLKEEKSQEVPPFKVSIEEELDALLSLNPPDTTRSEVISKGEEEDLDAWFDSL